MTYQDFKNKYIGKGIDFDNFYGFQCMDLAHQYAVEVVGKDFQPAPAAKDVWNQNPDGYEKIPNTPTGVPQQGDIMVWGEEVGPYGHIAVFDNGDVNGFVSLDQNWPVGSIVHLQNHNYKGVLGWFRPRHDIIDDMVQVPADKFEELVTKATKWDEHQVECERTKKLLHDNEETNKQKDVRIAELEGELDAFIVRNEELINANEQLKIELEACENEECPELPFTPENPSDGEIEPQNSPLIRFLNKILHWFR